MHWWPHPEETLDLTWSHRTPDRTGPLAKQHQIQWRAHPADTQQSQIAALLLTTYPILGIVHH